ncbi:hypothetical protein LCGC14_1592050, partial [marine sediment metagenome]
GLSTADGAHESSRYMWVLHRWHCDPFTAIGSWPPMLKLVLLDQRHEGKTWLVETDDPTPHSGYTNGSFQFTKRQADVYPDLNTSRLELSASDESPAVKVAVGTHTPNFDTVLASVDGQFYAFGGECTHRGGPLGEGVLEDDTVECPWHHGRFNVKTGEVVDAPPRSPVPTYRVQIEGDDIKVAKG